MKLVYLLAAAVVAYGGNVFADVPQTQPSSFPTDVKLVQNEQTIDVQIGGQPFTTYHFADDYILPYTRPFFYPVRANDGHEITIDQAQHKELHPHQRSIWIGHGNVNGANEWKVTTKPIQPKQRHVKFDNVTADSFQEELIWEDKAGEPMLNEVRTVRFVGYADGCRGMDVTLQFSPIKEDVTFEESGDTGLFAIRLDPTIAGNPDLHNSAGGVGGDGCSLKPADWCDESGQIDGKTYGAAILDYPANPRHPPLWHANKDQRLSSDIFSLHKFDPAKYPKGAGNFTIKMGDTATFRYLAVIHTGPGTDANLAAKYAAFSAQK